MWQQFNKAFIIIEKESSKSKQFSDALMGTLVRQVTAKWGNVLQVSDAL